MHCRIDVLYVRIALPFILLFGFGATSQAVTLPPGFSNSVVLSGLEEPTVVRFSSDGRVFVAERRGIIKVFAGLNSSTPTIFRDLRTLTYSEGDRGLLGLALHPSFPTVPYVYAMYTYDKDPNNPQVPRWGTPGADYDPCPNPPGTNTDGCVAMGRLSRFQENAPNVSTGGESVLVEDWGIQFNTHSVGTLMFSSDGALYASGGDGAGYLYADYGQAGNPRNPLGDPPVGVGGVQTPPTAEGGALRSQSVRRNDGPAVLDGTIIRIDPMTGAGMPNNPLASSSDPNERRIVGYGLRNPFRFTIRPGTTNDLWIGDVGWTTWEEINRIPNALSSNVSNFGWPCYEGNGTQPGYAALGLNLCQSLYNVGGGTPPYYAYDHNAQVVAGETCPAGSSSVSGMVFNQSGTYPATYQGALFFADYSRQCVWAMLKGGNGLPDPSNIQTFASGAFAVDLEIGPGGDLFYVDIARGTVNRIQYTSGNQAPNAVIQATPPSGAPPLIVNLNGSASSDPDAGDTLTYSWDRNGDGVFGDATSTQTSFTFTQAGVYTVKLRVTDSHGASNTASVNISVGNSAPTAFIDTPVTGTLWKVGQSITLSGHATDPDQGTLPASAFLWQVIMQHCPSNCHAHPMQSFPGVATASFAAPDHEYPSYIEIKLTVTDSGGLTNTKSINIDPQGVDLNFASNPSGLQLTLGSSSSTTPFARTVILGSANSVSANAPQVFGGINYNFTSWSDGGSQSHQITANAAATYTATYSAGPAPSAPAPDPPGGGGGGCAIGQPGTGDAMLPGVFLVILGLLWRRIKRRANEASGTRG